MRAIVGRDLDGFQRRKTGLHQQLNFALVTIARQVAANAGWVFARQQRATRLREGVLELHLQLEHRRPRRVFRGGDVHSILQVRRLRWLGHRFQHSRLERRPPGHKIFKYRQGGSHRHVMCNQVFDQVLQARILD